jgi:hypothetical protein
VDWRERSSTFEQIGAYRYKGFTLQQAEDVERVSSVEVSPVLFELLGREPERGRLFTTDEETPGNGAVVLLSHGAWRRRFGGNPGVIDQVLHLDGQPYTIVGVMPDDFRFPADDPNVEFWTPLTINFTALASRPHRMYSAIGRLRDGATLTQADADMQSVAAQIARENPDSNTGWGVALVPAHEQVVGDIGSTIWVLFGAVVLVLLIASANIANLLLARSARASKDFALRAAFGASRFDLLRRSAVETATLVAFGGAGPRIAVNPAENNAFRLLNRAVAAGGTVRFESGRYTVEGIADATIARWVEELAVRATRTGRTGGYAVHPRIALYQPWRASMDEGWTRWLLDQYGFAYTTITNTDVRGGNLRQRFDVIVLASDSPRGLLEGYAKGTVPSRYEGGIAGTGVRMLDAFVREGGTLVTLNQSADFAIQQLHLPVRNVVAGVDRKEFFASGSILQVTTDSSHPVMAGMPERAGIFVDGSPVFETLKGFEGAALATYASAGSPLLSGYLLGEKHLHGKAAALEVRHGRGRVLLIGFRPQWRGQPFGTFRVVFNAVLFGGELAARPWGRAGFWTTPADSTRR